jgi:hypothetical protein
MRFSPEQRRHIDALVTKRLSRERSRHQREVQMLLKRIRRLEQEIRETRSASDPANTTVSEEDHQP